MGRAAGLLFIALLLTACPFPVPQPEPPQGPRPERPGAASPGPRKGISTAALTSIPTVRARVWAPDRVPYDPDILGAGRRWVMVELENTGRTRVPLGPVALAFSASREGVPFPCGTHGGPASRTPPWLDPGESAMVERPLDCALPLPGTYALDVYVSTGEAAGPRPPGDLVVSTQVHVEAGSRAPRPHPQRSGLFVMMTGAPITRPLSSQAWARGDYHVLLSVTNGGPRPVPVGSGRLAFATYRLGSPLPCSGQSEPFRLPEVLASGTTATVQVPVACAPSELGRYEVVGRLALRDDTTDVEAGRFILKVTQEPLLFSPEPWHAWPRSETLAPK